MIVNHVALTRLALRLRTTHQMQFAPARPSRPAIHTHRLGAAVRYRFDVIPLIIMIDPPIASTAPSGGVVAGIVIGIIFGALLLLVLFYLIRRSCQRRRTMNIGADRFEVATFQNGSKA